MVVSEDYCLAPELSVFPEQLADAAEISLGGWGNPFLYHKDRTDALAF